MIPEREQHSEKVNNASQDYKQGEQFLKKNPENNTFLYIGVRFAILNKKKSLY